MPKRIQRKRSKGWRMPPNTVSVTRPGRWGNPFKVTADVPAIEAVREYARWATGTREGRAIVVAARRELAGKDLACWCREGEPCHGDVLLKLVNEV